MSGYGAFSRGFLDGMNAIGSIYDRQDWQRQRQEDVDYRDQVRRDSRTDRQEDVAYRNEEQRIKKDHYTKQNEVYGAQKMPIRARSGHKRFAHSNLRIGSTPKDKG